MIKKILLLLIAILFVANAYAQELGCCTNPNAGTFACNEERLIQKSECCPAPDTGYKGYYRTAQNPFGPINSQECGQVYFSLNQNCASKNECRLGCCCSEYGGILRSQIQCQASGTTFHLNEFNCNSLCPAPQCADGIDNDNNGCYDFKNGDSGCSSDLDNDEIGGICSTTGPQCNSQGYLPKITQFNIIQPKGEKKFSLSWLDECQPIASLYELFRCTGNCSDKQQIATSSSNSFQDDSGLVFGVKYTYFLVGHNAISTLTSSANKTISLGSQECFGIADSGLFCFNNSPYYCDDQNMLLSKGQRCQQDQVCIIDRNSTSCTAKGQCNYNNANPFGLFYTLSECESGRYCFYDKSYSVVNSCFSCKDEMQCYDYKSKESCERNNCRKGSCIWKPLSDQIGIGACIDQNNYNCKWCSQTGTSGVENLRSYNKVFDSCTKQKSDILSNGQFKCFYTNLTSKSCSDVACTDYLPSECIIQISLDSSNNVLSPSSDQCGIKLCQKSQSSCFKNSDGDNLPDCQDIACELDYYTPNTTIQPILSRGIPNRLTLNIYDKTGSNSQSALKTGTDYVTFFCIGSSCRPNISTSSKRVLIIGLSVYDGNSGAIMFNFQEGQNTLRYYSKDPSKNLEIVKEIQIEARANTSSPRVRLINVTNGNLVRETIYTLIKKPTINVYFFEPAIVTFARISNSNTNFGVNLNPSNSESMAYSSDLPGSLNDGIYTIEINAKNSRNIYMESAVRQTVVIDTISPDLAIIPANNAVVNNTPIALSLDFSEEVQLESVSLNSNDIKPNFLQQGQKYTSSINLTDGNKNLQIAASDLAGNGFLRQVSFSVDASPTFMQLFDPKYGVSPSYTFDVVIDTDNNAQCRYSFDTEFEYNFMDQFTTSSGIKHTIKDFNKIQQNDDGLHKLYVKCIDTRNKQSSDSFDLSVDTSPPSIRNLFAFPNPVVEEPGATRLNVETNEPAICRYSKTSDEFEFMQLRFIGYDDPNFRLVNVQNVTLGSEGDHLFNMACINKAGLISDVRSINVNVNYSSELTVESTTYSFFNSTKVLLSVKTNKQSQCVYSETDNSVQTGILFGPAGYTHAKELIVSQGSHTFYVKCRDSYLSVFSNILPITFMVDTTSPIMEYVDDSSTLKTQEVSCLLDRLRVKMMAVDNETSIREYFYTLSKKSDGSLILNTTKTTQGGDWFWVKNLNLQNNTQYYFNAKSKNNAGYESESLSSDGVIVDTSYCGSSKPLNCTQRGDCPSDDSCSINSDCESTFCLNNKCKAATCTDGIRNQLESYIDCGGPCQKCSNGKTCSSNDDCSSSNCYFGTCADQDKCFDGELTPGESDIDCGGPCLVRCGFGKACDSDSSCEQGLDCIETVCTSRTEPEVQEPVVTDTDGDGMPDVWEIANGLDPNDPSDAESDNDQDGLKNIEEFNQRDIYGESTDPNSPDTDGDGVSDKEEIDAGTNPLDPQDFHKSSILTMLLIIFGVLLLLSGFGYLGYTIIQRKNKENQPSSSFSTQTFSQRQQPNTSRLQPQMTRSEKPLIKHKDELKEKERKALFGAFDESTKPETEKPLLDQKETEKEEPKTKQKKGKQKKSKEDVFVKLKEISKEHKKSRRKKKS